MTKNTILGGIKNLIIIFIGIIFMCVLALTTKVNTTIEMLDFSVDLVLYNTFSLIEIDTDLVKSLQIDIILVI